MEKKCIVFVLGGSLLMSIDEIISIWCEAIRKTGLLVDYKLIYEHYSKSFQGVIIPKLKEKHSWTDLQVQTIVSHAQKVFRDINNTVNVDLAKKLMDLKEKNGYLLGVVTNKSHQALVNGLLKIGCSKEIFDYVRTSDDGVKKPDIAVFDPIVNDFATDEIIFVGNDPHSDWPMAQKLGIEFVPIVSPSFIRSFWEAMGFAPDKIFESVPKYIDTLI